MYELYNKSHRNFPGLKGSKYIQCSHVLQWMGALQTFNEPINEKLNNKNEFLSKKLLHKWMHSG